MGCPGEVGADGNAQLGKGVNLGDQGPTSK